MLARSAAVAAAALPAAVSSSIVCMEAAASVRPAATAAPAAAAAVPVRQAGRQGTKMPRILTNPNLGSAIHTGATQQPPIQMSRELDPGGPFPRAAARLALVPRSSLERAPLGVWLLAVLS